MGSSTPRKEKKDKKDKKEKKIKKEASIKSESNDITIEDAPEDALVKEKKEKKDSKDKKDKKEKRKEQKVGKEEDEQQSGLDQDKKSKKRKRGETIEDLEIDVNAPEPPSKKALRKLKKAKSNPELAATASKKELTKPKTLKPSSDDEQTFSEHASQSRSKYGVWIGNLSFQTTQPRLEEFLVKEPSVIPRDEITRIHLPMSSRNGKNRGFAYIDFKTEKSLNYAMSLSESLLDSRRVLIKNATDFSNRNATESEPVSKAAANISKNLPSKILYCGNLDFDVTPDILRDHFAFAGKVSKVRLATFQDTGKCKGFGFVDFEDVASVKRAMLGLTLEEEFVYQDLEGKLELDLYKTRKKRSMLGTRPVTMEFGEDPSVRYRKRFGKESEEGAEKPRNGKTGPPRRRSEGNADAPIRERREPRDNRSIDPGAAYSTDTRRIGAITEAKGKKINFD